MRTVGTVIHITDEFGPHLLGRDLGKRIRERHFGGPQNTWPSTIDFRGVEQATESCLDELLGTLARTLGSEAVKAFRVRGASREVADVIEYVLQLAARPPPTPTRSDLERLLKEGGSSRRSRAKKKVAG